MSSQATPLLSAVITVYNMEECLPDTLQCLELQDMDPQRFELIFVNDGSTDNSLQMLLDFAAKHDNAYVVSGKNEGPSQARNKGLSTARGEYVALLDSDDLFEPRLFSSMAETARKNDADVVVCRANQISHQSKRITSTPWTVKDKLLPAPDCFNAAGSYETLFVALQGWPWDKLYRRKLIEHWNLQFPANLTNSEDLVFVYQALALAERIAIVNDELITHRVDRGASVSNSRIAEPRDFILAMEMLQQQLQEKDCWTEQLEKGFLNWAFDFACWNIQSLPDGPEKDSLVSQLLQNEISVLRMDEHPLSYYNLCPMAQERYLDIKAHRDGTISLKATRLKAKRLLGKLLHRP